MDYVGGVVSKLKLPEMDFLLRKLAVLDGFPGEGFVENCHSFHPAKITVATKMDDSSSNGEKKNSSTRSPNHFTPGHLISNSISPTWGDLKTGDFPGKNWMCTDTPYKAQHAGGMSPPNDIGIVVPAWFIQIWCCVGRSCFRWLRNTKSKHDPLWRPEHLWNSCDMLWLWAPHVPRSMSHGRLEWHRFEVFKTLYKTFGGVLRRPCRHFLKHWMQILPNGFHWQKNILINRANDFGFRKTMSEFSHFCVERTEPVGKGQLLESAIFTGRFDSASNWHPLVTPSIPRILKTNGTQGIPDPWKRFQALTNCISQNDTQHPIKKVKDSNMKKNTNKFPQSSFGREIYLNCLVWWPFFKKKHVVDS